MSFFKKMWGWFKQAKISSWKATDKELTEAVKPPGVERVGSFKGEDSTGETYKGIKITLPLPEGK